MTKKTTRAKSAQKPISKPKPAKVITRAVPKTPRETLESYKQAQGITSIPPLSPGNIFETTSDNPAAKVDRIFIHEIGRSRFFSDTNPKVSERLINYEENGDMKEMKEKDFREYIEDKKYTKRDTRYSRRVKMNLPEGIKLGDKYASKDGNYEARVVGGNAFNIKVKITTLGDDLDSSFYRMYEAKDFGADKIFSDDILTYLGSATKNLAKSPARKIEVFDMSPQTPSDEELREQWRANNKKKQAEAVALPTPTKVAPSSWSTPLDPKDEEQLFDIFQSPEEFTKKMRDDATVNELVKFAEELASGKANKTGFGGPKPMVKTPDIPTEEDLEAFQQAMKEKIKKAHPEPVETNLFEVIGKTKGEKPPKDIRFTILGNDIDTELIKKINEHQEVEIYQIKRLSAVNVI
jgi:hypothetical protein